VIQWVPILEWSTGKISNGQAGLSPSRFRHFFKEQIGVSIRHYRLWRRVLGLQIVSQSKSLTEAALDLGFYDLAHFSNHFKKTFGLPPTQMLAQLGNFYVEPVSVFNPRMNSRPTFDGDSRA